MSTKNKKWEGKKPLPGSDSRPCRYFQKGECKFGNKCIYQHVFAEGAQNTNSPHKWHNPSTLWNMPPARSGRSELRSPSAKKQHLPTQREKSPVLSTPRSSSPGLPSQGSSNSLPSTPMMNVRRWNSELQRWTDFQIPQTQVKSQSSKDETTESETVEEEGLDQDQVEQTEEAKSEDEVEVGAGDSKSSSSKEVEADEIEELTEYEIADSYGSGNGRCVSI